MSFASGMILSLKNNKRTRKSAFKKLENYKNGNYNDLQINKKATSKQLHQIREKIQKENREKLIKKVLAFVILVSVFIYVIGFVKF